MWRHAQAGEHCLWSKSCVHVTVLHGKLLVASIHKMWYQLVVCRINDPNGPIYHNGQYHLFYQHVPDSSEWQWGLVWGHAKSKDMVSWEHLPHALVPTPHSPDQHGCFSGCATIDLDGRPSILYTGVSTHDTVGVHYRECLHAQYCMLASIVIYLEHLCHSVFPLAGRKRLLLQLPQHLMHVTRVHVLAIFSSVSKVTVHHQLHCTLLETNQLGMLPCFCVSRSSESPSLSMVPMRIS